MIDVSSKDGPEKPEPDTDVELTDKLNLQVDQNTWNRDVDTSLGHDDENSSQTFNETQ